MWSSADDDHKPQIGISSEAKTVESVESVLRSIHQEMASKKKQDEKNLKLLRELVSLASNKHCFDCQQRGPTYVNMTIGSFVCTTCSGLLRGLTPPHRVKSISMASFTDEEITLLRSRGNEYCRRVWLGLYDPATVTDVSDECHVKDFMINKYERKRFYLDPSKASLPLTATKPVVSATVVQTPPSQQPMAVPRSTPGAASHNINNNHHHPDPFSPTTPSPARTVASPQVNFANFDTNPIFDAAATPKQQTFSSELGFLASAFSTPSQNYSPNQNFSSPFSTPTQDFSPDQNFSSNFSPPGQNFNFTTAFSPPNQNFSTPHNPPTQNFSTTYTPPTQNFSSAYTPSTQNPSTAYTPSSQNLSAAYTPNQNFSSTYAAPNQIFTTTYSSPNQNFSPSYLKPLQNVTPNQNTSLFNPWASTPSSNGSTPVQMNNGQSQDRYAALKDLDCLMRGNAYEPIAKPAANYSASAVSPWATNGSSVFDSQPSQQPGAASASMFLSSEPNVGVSGNPFATPISSSSSNNNPWGSPTPPNYAQPGVGGGFSRNNPFDTPTNGTNGVSSNQTEAVWGTTAQDPFSSPFSSFGNTPENNNKGWNFSSNNFNNPFSLGGSTPAKSSNPFL